MAKKSTVLIYGTNLGGYRAGYALCKKGYKVILLNRGSYVDEIRNQALSQLPLDFCWACGHMPQRLFKAIGCFQDNYNAELLEVSGKAGDFKVKFKTREQLVNNFICTECDKCIEVCPVEVGEGKALYVHPEIAWENIYLIDYEHCTKCGKCEEICPTGALKLERPEEIKEVEVGGIILAPEFDDPSEEDLADFAYGKSPHVIKNSEISRKSLPTNFVKDSVKLPSGNIPKSFAVIITPHFNKPGVEFESYNLSAGSMYRAIRIKEIMPDADVTVFLRDYRGFGKSHYRWYEKALKAGVTIERAEELKVVPGNKESVTIKYSKNGKSLDKEVELAILLTGQKPPQLMEKLSKLCGIEADSNGFCGIRPFSPSETSVDGIFGVGEFTGPKGNPETIWEGCATLTEILKYLGEKNFAPAPSPEIKNHGGEKQKIGVFICSCFGTFEEKMDLKKLEEKVQNLPNVVHAEIIQGCCTPPTIKETSERIKESGVNRVVLAVCTPLQKLLKYRKTVMMAGLNPLLSEYVRLREDVINVHSDKDNMLLKAFKLIKSAVEKVKRNSQAPVISDSFTSHVVVIGGGHSGLVSAREIANNGFPVTIIEKKDKIGGNGHFLPKEQKNYLDKLIEDVKKNSNITIHTSSELKHSDGYAGNYNLVIDTGDGTVQIEAGIIIVSVGAKEYKPEGFLFGKEDRVITQSELSRRLENGKEKTGNKVAMIQCIGSKTDENPYCSRICCNHALENALALREKGSDVTIFYRDMTNYGKENLYKKASESGIKFVRFDKDTYPEIKKKGDTIEVVSNGKTEEADFIVLSTGVVPDHENNEKLSEILDYALDADGFFDSDANAFPYEEAIKRLFKPFELATKGIFPVGLAHSPRSFEESILTAKDAAGRALVLLGKKRLSPPNAMYIAEVKESLCMGCGICLDACPYGARSIDEIRKIAVVNPFLCDSCGSCVAICPNDASALRDFMGIQTINALDVLLEE